MTDSQGIPDDDPLQQRLQRLAARALGDGRYLLAGEVARGGMGAILEVFDRDLRRTIAMKVVREDRAEDESDVAGSYPDALVQRFVDEAEITGQLDHPGVVPVHELGVDSDGRVYFTMRLVRGRHLKDIIGLLAEERDGWTRTRALEVIVKVCETVAFAHDKGVIHRDLKPENVMVGRFGEVYVMDWGLAKVIGDEGDDVVPVPQDTAVLTTSRSSESPGLTQAGSVFGTPSYMAPELIVDGAAGADRRTDVYAVGAMLYTLLTGVMPYAEEDSDSSPLAVLRRVRVEPPRSIPALAPSVPPELVAICEMAMARHPFGRYTNLLEMAEDLRAFLENRVVRAYRQGALVEFRKWVTRNRGAAAGIAVALLVAVTGLLVVLSVQAAAAENLRDANRQLEVTNRLEVDARDRAERNELLARRQGYGAHLLAAGYSRRLGAFEEGWGHLERCDLDQRGWAWRHLRLALTGPRRLLGREDGWAVDVSADGSVLFDVQPLTSRMRIWNGGGAAVELSANHDPRSNALLSPDGSYVVTAPERGAPTLWHTADGARIEAFSSPARSEERVAAMAFSANGQRFAWGGSRGRVELWDLANQRVVAAVDEGSGSGVMAMAVSAGGDVAYCARTDGNLGAWRSGSATWQPLMAIAAPVTALATDASGGDLWVGTAEGAIAVYDGRTGTLLRSMSGHEGAVRCLALSSRGVLASGGDDRSVRLWDATGAQQAALPRHSGPVERLRFSPDGGTLYSRTSLSHALRLGSSHRDYGRIRTWSLGVDVTVTALRGPAAVRSLVFDARGGQLAAGFADDQTYLWNCASGVRLPIAAAWGGTLALGAHDNLLACGDRGGGLRLLRLDGGAVVELPSLGRPVQAIGISDDGSRVVCALQGGELRLVDPVSGISHAAQLGLASRTARFGPGLSWLALVVAEPAVGTRLLDMGRSGEHVDIDAEVLAFSPDGTAMATRTAIWTVDPLAERVQLQNVDANITAAAFSPDGRLLAAGYDDDRVRIWDRESGMRLVELSGLGAPVTALAFDPRGERLAAGAADGALVIWETAAAAEQLKRRARAEVVERQAKELVERAFVDGGSLPRALAWLQDHSSGDVEIDGVATALAELCTMAPERLVATAEELLGDTVDQSVVRRALRLVSVALLVFDDQAAEPLLRRLQDSR